MDKIRILLALLIVLMVVGCTPAIEYWEMRITDVETESATELMKGESYSIFSPRWSPAENVIVYYSSEDDGGLYRINSDGTNKTRIFSIEASTVADFQSIEIAWAPSGEKLLYLVPAGKVLKVISKEGTEEASVDISALGAVSWPNWSSGDQKIAFISGGQIYVVNSDGTSLGEITSTTLEVGTLSWVSAEAEIVFEAKETGSETWDVYKISSDGTGQQKLTTGRKPKWSPVGDKIAFISGEAFWVMDGNGQNLELLYNGFSYNYSWSPDGENIAYGYKTYVIDVDAKTRKEVPSMGGEDLSWSPDSKKIVSNFYIYIPAD
ncbi:MAG: hypothetical protein ABIH22_03830 [Candidatus Margulisiibacteriota bacterium]